MAMLAMGLGSIASSRPHATEQVRTLRYGFEVIRIHATWISTEMVDLKAIWDGAAEKFVRKPMC